MDSKTFVHVRDIIRGGTLTPGQAAELQALIADVTFATRQDRQDAAIETRLTQRKRTRLRCLFLATEAARFQHPTPGGKDILEVAQLYDAWANE